MKESINNFEIKENSYGLEEKDSVLEKFREEIRPVLDKYKKEVGSGDTEEFSSTEINPEELTREDADMWQMLKEYLSGKSDKIKKHLIGFENRLSNPSRFKFMAMIINKFDTKNIREQFEESKKHENSSKSKNTGKV